MEALEVTIPVSLLALLAAVAAGIASRFRRRVSLGVLVLALLPGLLILWVTDHPDSMFVRTASPVWLLLVGAGWLLSGRAPSKQSAFRRFGFVVLAILVINGAVAAIAEYGASEQRRKWRAEEALRLQELEVQARICVRDIRQRNPGADAAADIARGDARPRSAFRTRPMDPPATETHYEGACEDLYDGFYQPTGKWFTYTNDGYSLFTRPKSYHHCRREARQYAQEYNRQVVSLAPAAVRKFCRSQRLSPDSRRGAASLAVLGAAERTEVINGTTYQTKATWLFDTAFGPVLITSSYFAGTNASCRGCEAGVGVAYLDEDGTIFTVRRRWPLAWTATVRAGRQPENQLSLGDRLTSYPMLGISRCGWESLVELHPEGPIARGAIRLPYRQIENVRRDYAFDVVRTDTDALDHYEKKGDRFVGPHGRSSEAC